MAKVIREYQIRPMVCDWALDIPMGNTTFVLHFNSRNNAELVKAILEWEDSHPNEAIPYQPTLTPPNEALTLEELQEMDGEPVWCEWLLSEDRAIEQGKWFIVISGDKEGLEIKRPAEYGCHFCKIDDCGKTWLAYRRPPEGEVDT